MRQIDPKSHSQKSLFDDEGLTIGLIKRDDDLADPSSQTRLILGRFGPGEAGGGGERGDDQQCGNGFCFHDAMRFNSIGVLQI